MRVLARIVYRTALAVRRTWKASLFLLLITGVMGYGQFGPKPWRQDGDCADAVMVLYAGPVTAAQALAAYRCLAAPVATEEYFLAEAVRLDTPTAQVRRLGTEGYQGSKIVYFVLRQGALPPKPMIVLLNAEGKAVGVQ